jgi:hypothetical protein
MACFLVPTAVAVVTTVFRKKIPEKLHIMWLNILLWGGVVALALEHVAHEEIVPHFPFLSAMSDPADTATMLGEMATIGTTMLLACVGVWLVMVFIYNRFAGTENMAETVQMT